MPGVPALEDRSQQGLRSLPRDGHAVHVTAIPAIALIRYREQLIAVAAQAFGAAPWTETPIDTVRVIDRMWCAFGRRDFTAVAALDGPYLVGFAYGLTDDHCVRMDPALSELTEAFEVVELAVAVAYQGRGIGRALHDALLAEAPTPRLLLTHPDATARGLYMRWGWTEAGITSAPRSGHPVIRMRHDARSQPTA